jgi:predicted metal-binding membrane protein
VTALALSLSQSLRQARWRHPEWVAAGAAGVVWVVLLAVVVVPGSGHPGASGMAGHDMAGDMAGMAHMSHQMPHGGGSAGLGSWVVALAWWLAMAAGMMLPAALPTVRNLALTGPWSRRQRNIALFLAAYLAAWAAVGLVAVPAARWAPDALGVGAPVLLAIVLAVAAAWELTRPKRRALRACHLVPRLPPHGSRADRACLAAGLQYGRRCIVACWALMAAMAVAGHQLALMVLLTAVVVDQRLHVRGPRHARPIALVLAAAAVVTAAVAALA